MPKVSLYKTDGTEAGTIELKDEIFGVEVNEAVMHQVVVAQLARQAPGHAERADARGSQRRRRQAVPAKGNRQGKRQGSSRSPIMEKRRHGLCGEAARLYPEG